MTDTYSYFVIGYLILWLVLFVKLGLFIRKLTCFEKQLQQHLSETHGTEAQKK